MNIGGILFFVWIFGHNKILIVRKENGINTYYSKCSQCNRAWKEKELSKIPKSAFIQKAIKIRGHGKKLKIKIAFKSVPKKEINIYAL